MRSTVTAGEIFGLTAGATAISLYTGDWLAGACLAALGIGVKLLTTGDGIAVLVFAFIFQWTQVTSGVFYSGLTGLSLPATRESDYRPMVLIGLGCVLALAAGTRCGVMLVRRGRAPRRDQVGPLLGWPALIGLYGLSIALTGTFMELSTQYPSLRQALVTMTVVRLAVLFLVLHRLCHPVLRWQLFGLILVGEVALGFTGFFAGFRDPLILGALALTDVFNARRVRHWLVLATLVAAMAAASVMWMGIRATYRRDFTEIDTFATSQRARFERVRGLGSEFLNSSSEDFVRTLEVLIDRIWAIYYPALAISRVPSVLPHTNGSILSAAVTHVFTPRVFFPDKPELPSDSEKVRTYSGVLVAGREENTSIAFGYAAESYIDFGLPWMFVPIFAFGLLMGAAYAALLRMLAHDELAVASVAVIFWLSLYLFERSWANMFGYAVSLIVYFGLPVIVLDRLLFVRVVEERRNELAPHAESWNWVERS